LVLALMRRGAVKPMLIDRQPSTERHPKMTRKSTTTLAAVLVMALAVLALAGCGNSGKGNSSSAAPPKTSDGRSATIGVANEGLGKILVNSQGRTLYLFQRDTGTTSTCTGACAADWPPLLENGTPAIGSGANASMIRTTTRPDGKRQITYNRHPLYTFAKDKKAGDTNGQGLSAFGGLWYAVSPAGNQVTGQSSSGGGGGGGGYGY
jgi:predicted lipoprotein with Yx(FWY)xxD motif